MKSTSSAVWWIKNPKQTPKWAEKKGKQSESATLSRDMGDLFRSISMHGYSKLVNNTLHLWEKAIWLAVHVTTMCALLTVLALIWEQFIAQYIVINLYNPLYPIELVPFPSISICSNNRISYQAALAHAKELSAKDPKSHSVDYFLDGLKLFINLYHRNEQEVNGDVYSNFQAFLDAFDAYDNDTFYNTRRVVEMLSPSCSNLIRKCKLAGANIDCFGEKAFQKRLTSYGFCCTFNTGNFYQERSFRDRFVSKELGLAVVLNTSHVDDFVAILPIDGYIVIVHEPNTFPDTTSGDSQELFLTNNEESFIALRPLLVFTEANLYSISPITRKCYFNEDFRSDEVSLTYSFSDCISRCRASTILVLCGCVPFYLEFYLWPTASGGIFCTLQHVPCLVSYRFKLNNVLTQPELLPGLERAFVEALYCPECLPACNDIQYEMSLMSLPIDRFIASSTADELKEIGLGANNMSLLRVHFDEPYAKYYRRLIGNTWYEAFCTVGNVTSIFLGFSFVAVFEIGFFIVKYGKLAIKAAIRQDKRKHKNDKKQRKKDDMKLYICP